MAEYHFIEDRYHRYAIVEETPEGLVTVTTSVEPVDVPAAVRHLEEDGHIVHVEEHSGKKIKDPPSEKPYPAEKPRKAK